MLGHEFSSCWLKIGRAEEHANALRDAIASWEKKNPYVLTKQHDAKGEFYSINVQLSPVPDFDKWSLIFGDFIGNLRAALDHFIYAVAISQTKSNPPIDERSLQFIITDTDENFAKQSYRIRSLSDAVRTIIERVQPYNRTHQLLPPLLSLLRDFDDSNKHRLVKVTSCWQDSGNIHIECPDPHMLQTITYFPGEIQNRADIMAFTVAPPTFDVKYQYETGFTVGVSHKSGPTGVKATAVRKLLELLSEEVRTIIEVVGAKV